MTSRKGFTLIELLIVVAIIGILAAIAIPNFLEAQTRAKVARAKSEIRNLAVNLETYYIDHNTYPYPNVDDLNADSSAAVLMVDPQTGVAGVVPFVLTTPISYTSTIPYDPFRVLTSGVEGRYQYGTNFLSCWIMTSFGPDQNTTMDETDYPTLSSSTSYSPGTSGECSFRIFLSQFGGPAIEYDATNGTTSNGDVVRVGP